MIEGLLGILVSVLVGLGLWLWLPRGIVLVRQRDTDSYDTWTIQNDSPLPVRLSEVTISGISIVDTQTGVLTSVPLPCDGDRMKDLGVDMYLDDEVDEISRYDWSTPWNKVVLGPGDTMTAQVANNTTMLIKYRRAGWSGILERRTLRISGGA